MSKVVIDDDVIKKIKDMNKVIRSGDLGKLEKVAKKYRKRTRPFGKRSKYDCGQCVVCSVCLGTPTPDVEFLAVTGAAML